MKMLRKLAFLQIRLSELRHLSNRCNLLLRNGVSCIKNTANEYRREKLCMVPRAPTQAKLVLDWSWRGA